MAALYASHFAHDMGFSRRSIARKRRFLSPSLARLVEVYFRRPVPKGDAPPIDGDPFTDTQEYPSSFRVGEAVSDTVTASVPVTMSVGAEQRTVRVMLKRAAGAWRVDDLAYEDGSTFRKLLRNTR
ncbi:MAG: DUF3828 domain-containing protein [Gemmatimonadaceae bacterium]